jgi:hypothetical protein
MNKASQIAKQKGVLGSQFTSQASPGSLNRSASASRWTGAAAFSITPSSRGCGAVALAQRRFISSFVLTDAKRAPGLLPGSPSTINRRPHQGLGYKTPMSFWRLATIGALVRHGCGDDASLGQRWRVAHIPTATTAADVSGLGMRREKERPSFQLKLRSLWSSQPGPPQSLLSTIPRGVAGLLESRPWSPSAPGKSGSGLTVIVIPFELPHGTHLRDLT